MVLSNKYRIDFLSRVAQLLHWHYTIADGRVREIFLPPWWTKGAAAAAEHRENGREGKTALNIPSMFDVLQVAIDLFTFGQQTSLVVVFSVDEARRWQQRSSMYVAWSVWRGSALINRQLELQRHLQDLIASCLFAYFLFVSHGEKERAKWKRRRNRKTGGTGSSDKRGFCRSSPL